MVLFAILARMISNLDGEDFKEANLHDLDIKYFQNFLSNEEAAHYFEKLLKDMAWQQHSIRIFGRTMPQPRLTALYAETELPYTYSGLTLYPLSYPDELKDLQKKLNLKTNTRFTHCLANLYRNGKDSMGLHADDEKELGKDPVIASISLGETRKFRMKHKYIQHQKLELNLELGSLLIMQGSTQHFWKHELPKTTQPKDPRINLTFRKIMS